MKWLFGILVTTKGIARIDLHPIFDLVRLKSVSVGLLCAASILAAGIAYSAETKKSPMQTCPEPKKDEVVVRSASGRCAVKGPGIYSNPSAIGLGEPIVMINLGSFAYATVCGIDDFFDLRCEAIWSGVTKLTTQCPWTFLQVARERDDLKCRPKDTEVTISGTSDGIGPCIRLGPGTYKTPEELGLADNFYGPSPRIYQLRQKGTLLLKQKTHIVQIGTRAQTKMCTGDNFLPNCENGSQKERYAFTPFGTSQGMGCLRSMKVWNVCVPRDNQVALFSEPNAFGPCTIREVGEYLTAESLKIEGGAIRSIKVGWLVEARTCSDENMNGECVDIKERGPEYNVPWTIRSLTVRLR